MLPVSTWLLFDEYTADPEPELLLKLLANSVGIEERLPYIAELMLRLSNRDDLMGEYKNTRTFNAIAWVTCVVMIVLTVLLLVSQFFQSVPA